MNSYASKNTGTPPEDFQMTGSGLRFLLDPIGETAWATGYLVTGFSLNQTKDGWRLTIRVRGKHNKPMVAFITATSYAAVMETWYTAIHSDSYRLTWLDDKYAK